jgi:hypothetical protein
MRQIQRALPVPGTLVRYRETKSRWYFAVVRSCLRLGAGRNGGLGQLHRP